MRAPSKTEHVALALLAYVPFLLSSPGRVSADSKQYLYLDPGRFLASATDLWDPLTGAGTVPHQTLGYLFPVGPWFWVLDQLNVPDWIAQRLWLGTLSVAAGLGARWLFAQLGTGRAGAIAGALVYMLTPYQLVFSGRISVLLLPWAALPWVVGLTMRATRTRDWRAPALLGGVLLLTGGVNASSLLLILVAPALWVVMELGRGRARAVARSALRVAVISFGMSMWWVVGLRLQGRYGLPVLQLTENLPTVAGASGPGEILRGLGNWFFYIRAADGYAIPHAGEYANRHLVVMLSYVVPIGALLAATALRWAHRTYFVWLIVVGTVIGVGAWPFEDRTPYGSAWETLTRETSIGLALRNSPRVVPIIVLGFAALLAAAVGALPKGRWSRLGAALVALAAIGGFLPVVQHGYPGDDIDRPESLPTYWQDAAEALDAGDHLTRILEIPGASFAAYTWGTTVDPITPGLTDRPYLAREVLPQGTPATVNLLDAIDRRMQLGTFEPSSLVPLARLLGVGTVVLRADLDRSGRFDTPDPAPIWDWLTSPVPAGLAAPVAFPAGGGEESRVPPVSLFDVVDPAPIVRAVEVGAPVVLAGDGDGLVDAAAAGLLPGDPLVLYSGALDDDALRSALNAGARLVVTDSNRRRIQTWFYGLRDTRGPTEEAGRRAPDPTGYDARLDPFPVVSDDSRTVVEQVGGAVHASMEGGPLRPEDRAAHAVDGSPTTAWRVPGPDPRHHSLTLAPADPAMASSVALLQPLGRSGDRVVARVRVTVNDGAGITVDLGPESRSAPGQRVEFARQVVRTLRIEIEETAPPSPVYGEAAPVGFAEVRLDDVRIEEVVRPPIDLLARVGTSMRDHPLDIVLTRLRIDLPDRTREDDEERIVRRLELPLGATFSLRGTVRSTASPLEAVSRSSCASDLVTVDGVGVPVDVRPRADEAGVADFVACAPLALDAGSHRVEGVASDGVDVDRVILSTDEVEAPTPAGSTVRVVSDGGTAMRLRVRTDGQPFWLVLGQSASDGWQADAGDAGLGRRQVVNGYANGWLVTPEQAGTFSIDLRWEPQRLVWTGFVLSGLTAAGCVVVLLRRRREQLSPSPGLSGAPRLTRWSRPAGRLGAVETAFLVAVVVAGTACVAPLSIAVLAGVAAVLAAQAPTGAWVPGLAAPAALAASRVGPRPSLAWFAVAVLAVDLIVSSRREVRESG